MSEPLALVLSGGGARAAYQVGVLRAIAEHAPHLELPIITGVSAGAINAAYLAAHPGPFRLAVEGLADAWQRLTPDRVYRVRPLELGRAAARTVLRALVTRAEGPPSVRGLMDVEPLRRFLARTVDLTGIQRNIGRRRLRALALSTTCYETGETVTFVQGQDDIPMWRRHMRRAVRTTVTLEHVMASSAIPIVFPAVSLGDAFYGDGSVRQTAPLAPAVHLGARRVVAVAMRAHPPGGPPVLNAPLDGDYPSTVQVLGLLLHSVFLDSLDADAERLERVNHLLARVPLDQRPEKLQPVDLLMLRPSRDLGAMAREFDLPLPRSVEFAVRLIGGRGVRSADFLSYLMFQPRYTGPVMELGYDDGQRRWHEIEEYLRKGEIPSGATG